MKTNLRRVIHNVLAQAFLTGLGFIGAFLFRNVWCIFVALVLVFFTYAVFSDTPDKEG